MSNSNVNNSASNIDLSKFADLINNNTCHIATVSKKGMPNLAVASDISVINQTQLIISHNEMINTPQNILANKNVVITVFDKDWSGIRLFGEAEYYINGKYMELCNNLFKNSTNTPKGVIVVNVKNLNLIF